ncbi:Histidine kinase-, DNA gyrase B-, and HSP90-like ATPase [Paenibacillus sp. UNC496MF]|uniref:sensor histidine kinase n=1 Tax=Paenibacillus sp. UNC496MF TaxID=1502753 RepID=UPI0008E34A7B|nr:ATP-binding protein [Paenibacillus sp. UNC496MF]SFJ69008.1 Histidine kinase-, DNA gyrase B-, and HSP90-like ATPase [Paenibacillus sp. UNC496MF]
MQLIPKASYNRELNRWLREFGLFASLSLLLGVFLAWLIWRMVYRPIRIINKEITRFGYNQSTTNVSATGLTEFNRILTNFQQMSRRIGELIADVEEKEKRRGQLIELQNIRYDHFFNVGVDVDSALLELPIPRFILQPIVENALYYGFDADEGGEIDVLIRRDGSSLLLQVRDNGRGIPEAQLAELLDRREPANASGLGIGLRYVKQMLAVYFGAAAALTMESKPGNGTVITIRLPLDTTGGTGIDSSVDRG